MSAIQINACDFGIISALGIESGRLEDMLSKAVNIRGSGFAIKQGWLKGRDVVIARSGAGRKNAAHAAEALIDGHRPQVLISAGFAGGLSPDVRRYDIVLADSLVDQSGGHISVKHRSLRPEDAITEEGRIEKDGDVREASVRSPSDSAAGAGVQRPSQLATVPPQLNTVNLRLEELAWPALHVGRCLTVDHVVRGPDEKEALYQKHKALAVDMETFAVAEVCLRRNVMFCAVRVIHDAADDVLPKDVERLLSQKSEAGRLGAALGALWRRPGSIKDLWAMKETSIVAASQLAKFIEKLIAVLAEK